MTKKERRDLINDYLHGKLSKEKEQYLLSWIKKTEKNRNLFLKEQEELHNELISSADQKLELRWQTLLNRIKSKDTQNTKNIILRRVASIAAAFFIGVVLTIWINQLQPAAKTTLVQNIKAPNGARTNFELPDGSIVWLNSGSTLSFPSQFSSTRMVELSGEAYFDVKKGEKPFVISTDFGDVEVKGTSFNVKAFRNDVFETTLVSGIVNITEKNTKKQVTLQPGQQADILNSEISVKEVDTELFTSWKNGKLIFREEYLPSAVKRLERWYNVTIELDDDPRLSKIWYSGTLEMESFSEVLELLKVTAPILYQYNEKTRTIRIYHK